MKPSPALDVAALRSKAESVLRSGVGHLPRAAAPDLASALHELQTHQVELEIQNEELRRSHEELEASRLQLADLFERAPVGYLVLDRYGLIRGANQTAAHLLYREKPQLLELPFSALVWREDLNGFSAHLRQVFLYGLQQAQNLRLVRRDRSLVHVELLSVLTPSVAGEPPLCRSVILDATQRHAAEEAARLAEEELRQHTQRLETLVAERTARLLKTLQDLEHFSYTITHDLRAPLRSLCGRSGCLLEEFKGALPAPVEEHLQRVARTAERLDRFILDAMAYNKAVSDLPPVSAVDPGPLLRELLEAPQFQPPQAQVQLRMPLPSVQANPTGLAQCLGNLLHNAVKFVAAGKTPAIRVWAESRPPNVRFWIEDNGIGIPAEWHTRIFEAFERVNSDYEGTGLGLALVRKLAEQMGGQVGLESQPGCGSRFWLELKAAAPCA